MESPEIITTRDGSHSLLNTHLNETYHSVHGALQESRYVFIEKGLTYWLASNKGTPHILEIGFGTGLNALLALEYAIVHSQPLVYTTIEKYPLEKDVWKLLNYGQQVLSPHHLETLHELAWNQWHKLADGFEMEKVRADLISLPFEKDRHDIIFYDAFAPAKQPEMWEPDVLAKTVNSLRANGVFVTYCAKGQLKRDLAALGLKVETLPGPPGKKEMVRAVKS